MNTITVLGPAAEKSEPVALEQPQLGEQTDAGSTDPRAASDESADAQALPATTAEQTTSTLHLPVQTRGVAVGILAGVAVVFALEWAQSFLISLLLGILIAYTLNPLVVWLERIHIPRTMGATVVMMVVVSGLLVGSYALRGQLAATVTTLPEAANKLSAGLVSMGADQRIAMQKVQAAASRVEKATSQVTGISPRDRTTHVVVDPPTFKISNIIWQGSKGVLMFLSQAVMIIFLVFFLLVAGDTFKRKLVRLAGPSLSRRKITVHILDDINASIQRYMFMLLLTNMQVALLSWIAFRWTGLENAGLWSVAAGLMHVIPYFGPAVTAAATGMAAVWQFGELSKGLAVSGVSLLIATFIGTFVTTWMAGRIAKMNTAAVFVSLLFWGWLWGIWGMLLSIPIIVIMKVVSQHVEQLRPVAELLGE